MGPDVQIFTQTVEEERTKADGAACLPRQISDLKNSQCMRERDVLPLLVYSIILIQALQPHHALFQECSSLVSYHGTGK